jgi:MAGE family
MPRQKSGSALSVDNDDEFTFSQQQPELSQRLGAVKPSERSNLDKMSRQQRDKAILDLSRNILFKALAGEPIDRLKVLKEAMPNASDKISSAVMDQASARLKHVFGFELLRVPQYMESTLPKKYLDRLYVINTVPDDLQGTHSRAIHGVHTSTAIEQGLLMVCLAFCFCKGTPRSDKSRWITDIDLYRLLHGLDDNLPAEPPTTKRSSTQATTSTANTPSVDVALERFVALDYLLKQKINMESYTQSSVTEDALVQYSMGPRAAMEVGRRQVIFFCAEILDEQPDPTMLLEIANEEATQTNGEEETQ